VCGEKNYALRCTSLRASTTLSGLSEGDPFNDCPVRNVVETMEGTRRDSTPSLTRSSAQMGGRSCKGISSSVGCALDGGGYDSPCESWFSSDMSIFGMAGGYIGGRDDGFHWTVIYVV